MKVFLNSFHFNYHSLGFYAESTTGECRDALSFLAVLGNVTKIEKNKFYFFVMIIRWVDDIFIQRVNKLKHKEV